jgi:hypothetical protein
MRSLDQVLYCLVVMPIARILVVSCWKKYANRASSRAVVAIVAAVAATAAAVAAAALPPASSK